MENLKQPTLEKVILTKVYKQNKISKKNGKPYTSLSLLTEQYGDKWINGFGNQSNEGWIDGDTVEIEIYEDEWNGKKNLKFNTPRVNLIDEIKQLNIKVETLEKKVALLSGEPVDPTQGVAI